MGYLGRRIGKAQDQGDSNPGGADGAVGGGILDLFRMDILRDKETFIMLQELDHTQPNGMDATGGVISDYTEPGPGNVYRAHVFTTSGTFTVSDIGEPWFKCRILVVAGGGGGGSGEGGGGAGG